MRSLPVFALTTALLFGSPLPSEAAGRNAAAMMDISAAVVTGDTLSYSVTVTSAVETRVVELLFRVPEGLRVLSWEDGEFFTDPLRIGPVFHEPTRRVLVALAVKGPGSITESSGHVGTIRLLRTGPVSEDISLVEASLVDAQDREDCLATPSSQIFPARPAARSTPAPDRFALEAVAPNPMNRIATVSFGIPRPGSAVTVKIYDVTGRAVRTLVDGQRPPGYYSEVWDLSNDGGLKVAPGIYFCRMEAGTFKDTKKVIVLR
jgi:hypothetical protein